MVASRCDTIPRDDDSMEDGNHNKTKHLTLLYNNCVVNPVPY